MALVGLSYSLSARWLGREDFTMNRMRIIALSILALGLLFSAGAARALDPNEELGRSIFFDKQLSLRTN